MSPHSKYQRETGCVVAAVAIVVVLAAVVFVVFVVVAADAAVDVVFVVVVAAAVVVVVVVIVFVAVVAIVVVVAVVTVGSGVDVVDAVAMKRPFEIVLVASKSICLLCYAHLCLVKTKALFSGLQCHVRKNRVHSSCATWRCRSNFVRWLRSKGVTRPEAAFAGGHPIDSQTAHGRC